MDQINKKIYNLPIEADELLETLNALRFCEHALKNILAQKADQPLTPDDEKLIRTLAACNRVHHRLVGLINIGVPPTDIPQ
ncbi:MAG: hypothetical protein HC840_32505 [Leptolyngbyaceae cyanobacterium RM2_2_4]|nr:hypothetical protein [Leptolyngbyaceae cyanobacterium RM2_2_4]